MNTKLFGLAVAALFLVSCDRVNNASRTMDTMLGGDYKITVQGIAEPFMVFNGKVTSVPDKGYYIYYPRENGKTNLVQSPINSTTIQKID